MASMAARDDTAIAMSTCLARSTLLVVSSIPGGIGSCLDRIISGRQSLRLPAHLLSGIWDGTAYQRCRQQGGSYSRQAPEGQQQLGQQQYACTDPPGLPGRLL